MLNSIDQKLEKLRSDIHNSCLKTIILKLMSSIVSGLLLTFFIFLGSSIYNRHEKIVDERENLYHLYISMSDDYVKSCFGVPNITFEEGGKYTNNYYILNDVILRTVSDNGYIIAYFITSTKANKMIRIDSKFNIPAIKGIGLIKYSDMAEGLFHFVESTKHPASNIRLNYYCEKYMAGRWAMYNCYVLGTVTYGFEDWYSAEIIYNSASYSGITTFPDDLLKIRKKARPNTFGVIQDGYENIISILPMEENDLAPYWMDIYTILDNYATKSSSVVNVNRADYYQHKLESESTLNFEYSY